MLAGLKSSVCKITMMFQQRSEASVAIRDGGIAEQSMQQKWGMGYCTAFTRKLQQRRAFHCRSQLSATVVQEQKQRPVQSLHPTRSPLQVLPERQPGSVFSDVFSSLDLSSPSTPFGIKAFKTTPSQSLSEHCSNGPADSYVVDSLSTDEDADAADLITEVNAGLPLVPPKLCGLGTGGVYFLSSASGDSIAVFKPTDEEAKGINNPKGYKGVEGGIEDSLREGIQSGEGAMRERAAFLLDHQSISGVPATTMVSLTSTVDTDFEKTGSLQRYVPFDFDAEECGTGLFSVDDVHRICLADIRYVNTDRNGQNILVTKEKDSRTRLTPIDHGYCFPDSFSDLYFEWMHWPQAKQPFNLSLLKSSTPATTVFVECVLFCRFIEELDPEADLEILRNHDILFRPECNQVFLFVNYLLKWAVRRQCTPRDIAFILSDSSSSVLDSCFKLSVELSHGVMAESRVYEALNRHAEALMTYTHES